MNKQVLELQHIDFYDEKGSILFHQLLPHANLAQYRELLLKTPTIRNVWKHSEILKKLSFNSTFATIAATLTRLKRLRFAFDHYFPSFEDLKTFLSQESCLNELSSIDGLEIALLLNLSEAKTPHESLVSTTPSLGGSGTFFTTAATLLDLSVQELQGPFFLIAYCAANSRYLYKIKDPFTHDVKKESCGFGDLLANAYHPMVYY